MRGGPVRPLLALLVAAGTAALLALATRDVPVSPAEAASAKSAPKGAARGPVAVPDSAIGLSHTSVFATPAPPAVKPNRREPDEAKPLPRMFPGAPPRIPHGIADFVPITRTDNQCLDCHDRARAGESGAVAVPASHYRDLRRAPGQPRETVAGARYVCVSCHVPLTD
jgi:cytochrome c-type protein NapB